MTRAGQLFEVKDGNRRAIVSEQGASLVQVNWEGVDLLGTASDDGFAGPGAHGQILVPWPGRVAKGRYEYDGAEYRLPIDDHAHGAAIHGLVRWATWQLKPEGHERPGRISLSCRLLATPGYPFPLELLQSYSWEGPALEVAFSATNIGTKRAPFGYGCHPYFFVGTPSVDQALLRVPADSYVPADRDLVAAGPPKPVEGTPWDFREPKPIGDLRLDLTLADLSRDETGRFSVELSAPDGSRAVECSYEEPVKFLQLYSGDTLPFGQRRALAIEPYTCVPDAFNNGAGLIHLAPGATVTVRWAIKAAVA
jgi:aldose 1-epimerase